MATSQRLTKSEVENITAEDVHKVLSRTMLADGFDVVYDMEKSEGPYLFDKRSGKKYLDLFSFFASWPISHNHEKLKADKKFLNQIAQVALHNPANSDIYTIEMAQFVATFERVAMPAEFKHLFFVQGGSQAVENALKTAMDWKVRKNLAEGKGEKGNLIVHFKEAFHGRGGYTMSLTNTQDPNKYKYFALFKDWPRIHNPKAFFPLEDPNNLKKTVESEKKALNELTEVLNRKADEIAAIILEPVQGEGGDNHFRPEFWQALRKIADKYSVLLIADEVQAGMGLSGKFWTWQHLGATPDIVCFGKKSQVCGIMATSKIDTVKDNVFVVSSRINSTWGGNLVDMVRARKFLEIIEEDKLVDNAQTVGAYWLKQLQVLQKEFPAVVSNVRGKGLLLAFDVASPDLCNKIKQLAYQKNVLIISCGTQTIRFRPFLDTNVAHVDEVVKVLKSIFAELQKAKL